MRQFELTDDEHEALVHVLDAYLSDLRVQIVDTDSIQFKDMLKSKKETLTHVREKLAIAERVVQKA